MIIPFIAGIIIREAAKYAIKKGIQYAGKKAAQRAAREAAKRAANLAKKKLSKAKKNKKSKICKECQKKYKRPSGYRKGVRDKVWKDAKGKDGKVRDPLTGKEIKKGDKWDMGHKPGYEFRKHQQSAANRGISRKQFLDEHNTPRHYRPELPSSNRGHAGEMLGPKYFGF